MKMRKVFKSFLIMICLTVLQVNTQLITSDGASTPVNNTVTEEVIVPKIAD